MAGDLAASSFDSLLELFGDALAVGGAVVDHADGLALEGGHCVLAQGAAQVNVVSHHAEGGGEALAGVLGVGGRGGDLGDAGILVDLRCGNRGAGIQVTDDTVDLGVDQLGGHRGALLRITSVVFRQQFDGHLLAADGDALGVQFLDGHARAVFVVLAEVGDGTARGTNVADLDHGGDRSRCRGCSGRRCGSGGGRRRLLFFAAGNHQGSGRNQGQARAKLHLHRNSKGIMGVVERQEFTSTAREDSVFQWPGPEGWP